MSKWSPDVLHELKGLDGTYEEQAAKLTQLFPEYRYTAEAVRKKTKRAGLDIVDQPRILLFDIETLPILGYTWGVWNQNIAPVQIKKDWCILSYAAKWLFSDKIYKDVLTHDEALLRSDKRICWRLWELMDEADVIVAHNLRKFDRKRSNTRFILNGFNPPAPYQLIDTLEVSKQEFAFTYNKLDYLGRLMANKKKLDTDFQLWIDCDEGNKKALMDMLDYNVQDVYLLEEVYMELRPWFRNHPNLSVYTDGEEEQCGRCLSTDIKWTNKNYVTPMNKYQLGRCNECGGWVRVRKSELSKAKKKVLTKTV